MPAMKTMLVAMSGAVILGSLAANAVPTRIGMISGSDWRDTIPRHASADTGEIEHYVAPPEAPSTALAYNGYDYDYVRYPDYDPVDVPAVDDAAPVPSDVDAAVVEVSYGASIASAPDSADPVLLTAQPAPESPVIVDAPVALAVNTQSGW